MLIYLELVAHELWDVAPSDSLRALKIVWDTRAYHGVISPAALANIDRAVAALLGLLAFEPETGRRAQ